MAAVVGFRKEREQLGSWDLFRGNSVSNLLCGVGVGDENGLYQALRGWGTLVEDVNVGMF